MKDYRATFIAAGGADAAAKIAAAAQPAPTPPAPKLSRKARRANATLNRRISNTMKKANELGLPISMRTDEKGRTKVVMGKPKKRDSGPQPGEVITSVDGNVMPELPGMPAFPEPPAHVHTEDCRHVPVRGMASEEATTDIFAAADKLVEDTLGR